jgi:hypothetical protein
MSDLPTVKHGEKLKKAIQSLSEESQKYPEKSRAALLDSIVIRYDLSPKESQFLLDQFTKENNRA